jgi:hypothetical protein
MYADVHGYSRLLGDDEQAIFPTWCPTGKPQQHANTCAQCAAGAAVALPRHHAPPPQRVGDQFWPLGGQTAGNSLRTPSKTQPRADKLGAPAHKRG